MGCADPIGCTHRDRSDRREKRPAHRGARHGTPDTFGLPQGYFLDKQEEPMASFASVRSLTVAVRRGNFLLTYTMYTYTLYS
jgi:hypothetical protein